MLFCGWIVMPPEEVRRNSRATVHAMACHDSLSGERKLVN
jgi:hypothetical protein